MLRVLWHLTPSLGNRSQAGSPMSNQCRNPCREAGHYQACPQAGEETSPDHGDPCGRTWAPTVLMVLTPGARGFEQEQGIPERAGRALVHWSWERHLLVTVIGCARS